MQPVIATLLATGDPLFKDGFQAIDLLIVLIKALVAFGFCVVSTALMIWFERRAIALMQARIGPNRAGPFGLLQTLADGTKLFFKETFFPERADNFVFRLAPYLSAVPAFLTFAVIPVGGTTRIFGHATYLQLADPPMGVLFSLAISSIAVYGVMLAGWSSGSKYPLLGSVRASAQMISYEAAMGLSLAAVVLVTGSLSTHEIVKAQEGSIGNWHLLTTALIPAVIFAIAGTAELNRPPFDLVEAEQELVGGFNTEYSAARFAMFYLAEFMNTITMSALIVTLFLGGPNLPFRIPVLGSVSVVYFAIKLFFLLFTYVWLRATLPRFRYDQLMDLGWKKLVPAALVWLLALATIRLGGLEVGGTLLDRVVDRVVWFLVAVVGAGIVWLALWTAMKVGRATSEAEFERDRALASTTPLRTGGK